jgi:transposase
MGCSGRTAHRFLRRWEELGCWDRLHADLLRLLRRAGKLDPDLVIVDAVILRAFGGELTGPSPVDRGKKGSKHTLLVDRHGVPLAIRTAGANASDHTQIIPLVLDFPKVTGKPGRPKELPDELYADRGYDSDATRRILSWLGIEPHIGRRKTPRGSGLGKVRWVVERALSWLKGLRRMRVRYDRLAIIQENGNTLAARVICFRLLHENRRLGWIVFLSSCKSFRHRHFRKTSNRSGPTTALFFLREGLSRLYRLSMIRARSRLVWEGRTKRVASPHSAG